MKDLSLLIEECSSAFLKTEEYGVIKNYRSRSCSFSFEERLSIERRLMMTFAPLYEMVRARASGFNDADLLYSALSVLGCETFVIAAFFCITKEGIRSRKHRLYEKLPKEWFETMFTKVKRYETPSETFHLEGQSDEGIPLPAENSLKAKVMEKKMNLTMAVAQCYRKCFTYEGRARRAEFWYFWLYSVAVNVIFTTVNLQVKSSVIPIVSAGVAACLGIGLTVLHWVVFLGIGLPMMAVIVRRLHDRGMQGWISILLYGLPALITEGFCYLQKEYQSEIMEELEFHSENVVTFFFGTCVVVVLVLSAFIARMIMMGKAGDVGPNDYGADPVEVFEPNGTGLEVFRRHRWIAVLVLAVMGSVGIGSIVWKDDENVKAATEIVSGMQEYINRHEAAGIRYYYYIDYEDKVDRFGRPVVVQFGGGGKGPDLKTEVRIKPYRNGLDDGWGEALLDFKHVLGHYKVSVVDETDECWKIWCKKRRLLGESFADWRLVLEVSKKNYEPVRLTRIVGNITYVVEDIVFGDDYD